MVQSDAGRWRAAIEFPPMKSNTKARLWRAMLAYMQGRANAILIGPYDTSNVPGVLAGTADPNPVYHSDGSGFSDGSAYYQAMTPAEVVGAVASGATSMTIDMLAGHDIEPGHYFSVIDRLYIIRAAEEDADTSDRWIVNVWPPVREAIAAGAIADFDRPLCRMRMENDDTGRLNFRFDHFTDAPQLQLVEAPADVA